MNKTLLLALPLVLATACGGSSGGLGKAAYVAQAEVICAKANADVKAITFPTTPAAIVPYANSLVDIADRATQALAALDAPSADKANLDKKVLTPLKAQVAQGWDYVGKIKAALAAQDQKALGDLIASPPTQTKADTSWMTSYGFKACVESAKTDK